MSRRHGPAAGFTLVELLVATAILGLVALLLANGMRFIGRATARAEDRREAVETTLTGLGLLRASLGRAIPLMVRVEARSRLVFEGGEERLRFAVVEPDYMPGWPLAGYELTLVPDGFATRLAVRRGLLDPAKPDLARLGGENARAILGFPAGARFTYYGARRPREEPTWHTSWTGAQQLPRAVRIGSEADAPGWPDFVIPLAIDTPAGCLGQAQAGRQGQEQAQAQGDADAAQACPQ